MIFDRLRESLAGSPPDTGPPPQRGTIQRRSLIFHGRVQGVGFRYTMQFAARDLGITGWCRNEYDGTVSSEVQGSAEAIHRLIRALQQGGYIRIERIDTKELPVDKNESGFRVR